MSNSTDAKKSDFEKVKLTYYYIAKESSYPVGNDVEIKECGGKKKSWGKVSKQFYDDMHMEGTGKMKNGEFLNCGNDDCTCFNKVPGPTGSHGDILHAYTSGASKSIPYGTLIYMKEFDGLKLPNGQTHNGCVRIEDTGYGLADKQVDFFAYYKDNYERINAGLRKEHAHIKINANCELKKYSAKIKK